MINTVSELGIDGYFLNLIKRVPTKNLLNDERLNAFHLRLGEKRRLSPEKDVKYILIGKTRVK